MNSVKTASPIALAALLAVSPTASRADVKSRLVGFDRAVVASSTPPVGIEVFLQAWNPLIPAQDAPRAVLNESDGIGARMNAAWNAARAALADPKNPNGLPALLAKGGLIAKGVNLYSISFTTSPLSAIDIQQGGVRGYTVANNSGPNHLGGAAAPQADAFTIHWVIPGSRLDFRATTPDVVTGIGVSRDVDPKLSVQLDLDITLGVAVSDQPGQPALAVTQTTVLIANPRVDSGNLSGDVLTAVTNFASEIAYGKNLNTLLGALLGDKNLAADPQHGGFDLAGLKGIDVKGIVNEKLRPLNADIARSGIGDALRVGLWAKNTGHGGMLALLFAPKALPLPPQNGAVSGSVTFDNTVEDTKLPTTCSSLVGKDGVDVEVQIGPRKVLDIDPISFGTAPMQRLTHVALTGGAVSNRRCAFTLTGLVDVWPNNISFPAPAVATRGSLGSVGHYLQLKPDNWASPLALNVSSQAANHNLVASGSFAYNAGVGAQRQPGMAGGLKNPGDPAMNPGAAQAAWGARQATGTAEMPAATGSAAGAWGARQGLGVGAGSQAPAGAWGGRAAPAAGAPGAGLPAAGSALSNSRVGGARLVTPAPAAPAGAQQIQGAQP